ncbi:hypothetical protein SAMN05421858_1235 [Haladaptatus litoreus]|uniref:Membrane domain of glycerophosphoryl diester phosphodiesterase n=1 Tax=Haladaptatus litoreus TaxID=553468 RepID=A0A1N6XQS5_9EURY|nr:hypothetical protein [Haladaptatus litoreus]SIR04680.1 hypothetical protein SAMN05421858_1235 [Haladaptatus litoreus]
MPWYAVEALDDAIETTKAFLLPFELWTWLKLAVIVLFVGGTSTSPPGANFQFGGGGSPGGGTGTALPDIPFSNDTLIAIVVAVVAAVVSIWLVLTFIGSIMEFAFVESLRSREVHVRSYIRRHFGQGVRLFGFRVVLVTLLLLPIIGFLLIFVPSLLDGSADIALGSLFVFVPVMLVLGLVVALIDGLTTNFVVPVMLLRGDGVLAGWRAFWPTLRSQWKQYGMYILLRFALSIAAGIVVGIVGGILSLFVLIPFAILGIGLYVLSGSPTFHAVVSVSPLGAAFGLLALLGFLCLLFVLAVVRVPIQTYLRYFALLVLGDTNRQLDLIPELREEIR